MSFEKDVVKPILSQLTLKNDTNIGDVVLIFREKRAMFAVVTDIIKNVNNHHQEWWDVTFKLLDIPLKEISWTLRTEQMTGKESFTMDGANMFFAPIDIHGPTTTKPFQGMKLVTNHPKSPPGRVLKEGSKKGLLKLVVDNTKK